MSVRNSRLPHQLVSLFVFAMGLVGGLVALPNTARAEEVIIKRAGDHPTYSVELEPHALLAFFAPAAGSDGLGLGGRATIPIVKNGFVGSINNSVGIGFGLDWVHYNGCYHWRSPNGLCANLDNLWIPVVMQWNFFLSTHWSVFGEPGLALHYSSWGDGCVSGNYVDAGGGTRYYDCGNAPSRLGVDPFVLFVGGRYHFTEQVALTMRIGWPYASVGVSFFP